MPFNWSDYAANDANQTGGVLPPVQQPPSNDGTDGVRPGGPYDPSVVNTSMPAPTQPSPQGGSFADKMRAVVMQKHPDWTPDQVQNQVQYYVNKNNDPGEIMGNGQRATEEYWLGRESGAIPAEGGGGGMSGVYGTAGTFGSLPGFSSNPSSPVASFDAPGLLAPWKGSYSPPNVTDDPGFQFRLDQGQQALERSAAAKGTLLTGGTVKDLAQYSQGLASQEYGAADARDFRNYQNDQNTFYANQNNAFNKLSPLGSLGMNAAANAGQFGQTGAGQGLSAANMAGQYGTSYGMNSANLAIGQGNASASGTVANSNANNSEFNSLGNIDWKNLKWNNKPIFGNGGPATASPGSGG